MKSNSLTGAHIAILGYGPNAPAHARGLREAGNFVSIGTRSGGMSGVRARRDGFIAAPAAAIVDRADIIVSLVPDEEQASLYWHAIEPNVKPGSLLVFERALALETRIFEPQGVDVVFIAADDRTCRIAVHADATSHALERALAYARAAYGKGRQIVTTTIASECEIELAALEDGAGSEIAFKAGLATCGARARDSHAPEEARISFYGALSDIVERRSLRRYAQQGRGHS